jgi:zinc D-Ala-D-Ala carboxypeptidase
MMPPLGSNISRNHLWAEVVRSQTAARFGIDNTPTVAVIPALVNTAARADVLDDLLYSVITVSSWYRCLELNRKLGSKDHSQHVRGEAIDFECPKFGSPLQIVSHLTQYEDVLKWDQLILEHSWVHISFCSIPYSVPRGDVITLLKSGSYAEGITDMFGNKIKQTT